MNHNYFCPYAKAFNSTHFSAQVFNKSSTWSWHEPRPLLEWVSGYLSGVVGWVEVSGRKSSALNTLLHKGPTLLVFAPDKPELETNACFDMVRTLSMNDVEYRLFCR